MSRHLHAKHHLKSSQHRGALAAVITVFGWELTWRSALFASLGALIVIGIRPQHVIAAAAVVGLVGDHHGEPHAEYGHDHKRPAITKHITPTGEDRKRHVRKPVWVGGVDA